MKFFEPKYQPPTAAEAARRAARIAADEERKSRIAAARAEFLALPPEEQAERRAASKAAMDATRAQWAAEDAGEFAKDADTVVPFASQGGSAADAAAGFVARRSTKARAAVVMTGAAGWLLTSKKQAESVATGKKFKRGK